MPEYVTSYELPDEMYDYAPGYEGYRYFVANEEIVIVDPGTTEVVPGMEETATIRIVQARRMR